jgi:Ca2+-binding EF-hand superfamily protein
VLIQQLVFKLRATSDSEAPHRRIGKPAFACTDPKGVFAAMDTDGSGELDSAEFEQALRKLGLPMHKTEAAQLMAALDTDNSGTIDEQEFFAVVRVASEAEAEVLDRAVEKKRQEDSNAGGSSGRPRSGSVSRSSVDLANAPIPIVWVAEERSRTTAHGKLPIGLQEVPKHHTFPQALRFGMGKGTEGVGGDISKASGLVRRFVNILSQKRNIGDVTQEKSKSGTGVYEIDPRAVFDSLDEDGSGELDADEFEIALSMLGCGFSRPMVRQLMAALDTDNSGTVDYPEFEALFIETQAVKAANAGTGQK